MATNNTGVATEAPKKKRKQQGPRQKPLLNILLSIDVDGKPELVTASYNAQDTLTAYVEATKAGKVVNLLTWQEAAKAKTETPAA